MPFTKAYFEARDKIFNQRPNECPACESEQLQLVQIGDYSLWRCRVCRFQMRIQTAPDYRRMLDELSKGEYT